MKGMFIVMEGPDGSGKSTQIELLKEYLNETGRECVITREPGGTVIGEAVRSIILNPEYEEMSDVTEMLLYAASRAQLMAEVIVPALKAGKVVITATQMLDSMMIHPRPTRAETTDVANAIAQGTSAIMLSGETAAGKYPVEALKMMVKIAVHMERNIDYNAIFRSRARSEDPDITNAISHATCMTAIDLKANAILAVSKTGNTARMISKYRPECLIAGCSSSERVCRQLNLSWGILPLQIREEYSSEILCLRAIEAAQAHGIVEEGDKIVFTGGIPLGIPGRTNLIRVCIVGE